MTKPRRRAALPLPLPLMMADLAFASWETMLRRTVMMAQGNCSPAEYQRMVLGMPGGAGLAAGADDAEPRRRYERHRRALAPPRPGECTAAETVPTGL